MTGKGSLRPNVMFVNKSEFPNEKLLEIVHALDLQLKQFAPVWGVSANLRVLGDEKLRAGDWQVVLLDDADSAIAYGYHDLTYQGTPISKIFVKPTEAAGQKVSVTISHELLEMLVDPGAQLWAQSESGLLYAYEVCDAVEGVEYEVEGAHGVPLSDFVYPEFFEPWHMTGAKVQFDHKWKVSRPFQTLRNGYQIVSYGSAIVEEFGSVPKMNDFCTREDRSFHRSEYRIWRARGGGAASKVHTDYPFDGGGVPSPYLRGSDDPYSGWVVPSPYVRGADDPFSGWGVPSPYLRVQVLPLADGAQSLTLRTAAGVRLEDLKWRVRLRGALLRCRAG